MNNEEQAEAVEALTRWFGSQGIGPEDAVPVMVKAIAFAVHSVGGGREREREGLKLAARMVKEAAP
jgi:hypothetical protein